MPRHDGREDRDVRPIEVIRGFTQSTPGSVLYKCGRTTVLATATIEDRVPKWLSGRGQGWLTAEYAMLPGSTGQRKARARAVGRIDGRTHEIQRLVGRALRSVTQLKVLGERTVWLDCDILEADGGTRTASINAAYIALCDALKTYRFKRPLASWPIAEPVGAISVGIVDNRPVTDLDYEEDHRADVDMNVVMTASGAFLEVQGTGESRPFSGDELTALLDHARTGIEQVIERSREAMAQALTE